MVFITLYTHDVSFFVVSDERSQTWVVGDSIVRWAGEGNPQLPGGGEVF